MEISELLKSLLAKRGVESEDTIAAFLNPAYEAHLHDPMLLSGMQMAIERFFVAFAKKERIALYTDYDCDGIGGAVVLSDFLKKIGYENWELYMPHRDREGYGFHAHAVEELAARGASLIITADVGITAVEAVDRARELSVDVIITDHHEPMGAIPRALAVVNPKLEEYPFPHLCGAAVAFKLVQALLTEGKRRNVPQFLSIPDGWEKWLLDVVALATISDMVPLSGENRTLVHFGLHVLRRSRRVGIRALCESARIQQSIITEDDIGFGISPRINAASRMDEPRIAFDLLTTHDRAQAELLAQKLEALNAQRKGIVAGIVKQAKKRARERFTPEDTIAVLGDTAWKPSLLGLAANSLMQERGGVVCLWGRDAEGKLKGSCRSDDSISLVDLFANTGDLFEHYGGHEHAGGFTVSHERVHLIQEELARAGAMVSRSPSAEKIHFDASLPLSLISNALYSDVSRLSPFGMGNPKPIFLVPEVRVTDVKRFGKEKNHVEVMLECATTGRLVRSFDFFKGPEHFTHPPTVGVSAKVFATIERDTYRGPSALALRLVDIVAI